MSARVRAPYALAYCDQNGLIKGVYGDDPTSVLGAPPGALIGRLVEDIADPQNRHFFRRKRLGEVVLTEYDGVITPGYPIHIVSFSVLEHAYFKGAVAVVVPRDVRKWSPQA